MCEVSRHVTRSFTSHDVFCPTGQNYTAFSLLKTIGYKYRLFCNPVSTSPDVKLYVTFLYLFLQTNYQANYQGTVAKIIPPNTSWAGSHLISDENFLKFYMCGKSSPKGAWSLLRKHSKCFGCLPSTSRTGTTKIHRVFFNPEMSLKKGSDVVNVLEGTKSAFDNRRIKYQ